MWHPIQHFLRNEIFYLQQSQGNLSLQVHACATQQLYYALLEAPVFKSLMHLSLSKYVRNSAAAHM